MGASISIWDDAGNLLRKIKRDETLGPYIGPIAFMPESHLLLGPAPTAIPGRQKNSLALWNADTGDIERLVPGPSPDGDPLSNRPRSFALSPDGSLVAFSVAPANVMIYSTRNWTAIDYHNDKTPATGQYPVSVAWSLQNFLAIGFMNGVLFMDPAVTPSNAGFILNARKTGLRGVGLLAFSPDGRLLALGVSLTLDTYPRNDGGETEEEKNDLAHLKVWDVVAKKFIAYDFTISTPADVEWAGQYLLALTTDGHLRVYQPLEQGGTPYLDFDLHSRPYAASFSAATGELAVVFDSAAPTIEIYKITTDKSAH